MENCSLKKMNSYKYCINYKNNFELLLLENIFDYLGEVEQEINSSLNIDAHGYILVEDSKKTSLMLPLLGRE